MTRPDYIRSASVRLAFTYVAVFSLSVMALGLFTYITLRNSIEQQLRTHIDTDIAQLMGDYRDDGLEELRHDIQERIEASPANRLRYFVANAEGKIIFDKIDRLPDSGWHYTKTKNGTDILLRSVRLDGGYRLAVAADLDRLQSLQAAIRHSFGLALLVTLVLGILGSLVVSRRFLARLESFNRTAERVGSGALAERLPLSGSGDDFDHLALIINRMLARIEQLVGNVKQVSTNIAHDLRTPLGRIRQKLESLRYDNPEQIDAIIAELDASLDTFAGLLRIAEIESGARKAGFVELNLSSLLAHIAETYAAVAEEQGITLTADIAPNVRIQGDAVLLSQAAANLIENALRHASAKRIHVALTSTRGGWCASISDNGIGIPAHEYANVTQAFTRLDASRSTPGNGLGLNLVAAIATLHDAMLSLHDNSPGLRVMLEGRAHA